ncbi:MAG TPA: SDR family oxidoreductase [Caulobacteraceae bacterium]|jgi:NAD(P)-dependent dehydrogenase (short-subunit alcohol dehydrogenase family)
MTYNNPPPLPDTWNRLRDRVVIVTGASSGIGEAATRLFAAEGARVIAAARRVERIEALAAELRTGGLEAAAVTCDVRNEDSVAAMVEFALKTYGRLDGAFNNAGAGGGHSPIHEADTRAFDHIMAVNLRGVFLCLKHETAAMVRAGGPGSIVNVSSIGGLRGGAHNSIYSASKFGLEGLTRCAARDYAALGIRVNAIAPGPTRSEMFDRWMPDEAAREGMAALFPMNYIAHPQDMARAALFLLSDEARWTTGVILPCEGGMNA